MLVSSGLLQVKILWLTITWRWRSFKLKMSPQATGLNAVPIQMIPWETSVTHNITCGKRGSEQMTYSLLYQLSFRCMSPSEILWRTWDFWGARNNRSSIWLFLLLPHSRLDEGHVPSLSHLTADSDNKRRKGEGKRQRETQRAGAALQCN